MHDHFLNLLGVKRQRQNTINWVELEVPRLATHGLDNPFSESEIWAAIVACPAKKAPGPDGFTGQFFRSC